MAVKSPLTLAFNLPFHEAIAAARERGVVLPDVYYGELQGVARQLAFSVAGIASLDQLQSVKDSLDTFMAEGGSFKDWQKTASAKNLQLPAHRLDNIWRTNLQGNYMRGKWEQFQSNVATRPYLMYDAINDSRVRPSHLAHDGVIRAADDPFWRRHSPPLGYRCRCSLISLTEAQARDRSQPGADGASRGLYKNPQADGIPAGPDSGWDYNPFEDRLAGIKQAIEARKARMKPGPLRQWMDDSMQNSRNDRFSPVSKSITLHASEGFDPVRRALRAIDRAHDDGNLPKIPIELSRNLMPGDDGEYWSSGGRSLKIVLSEQASAPEFTVFCEIGHFIDHRGFDVRSGFESENPRGVLGEVIAEIEASRSYGAWNRAFTDPLDLAYLNDKTELWSRAYAQWVSLKCGDVGIKLQADGVIAEEYGYWSWDEFTRIEHAIDKAFRMMGWI